MQIEVTVHSDLSSLREDWLDLQSSGLTTLYQTYEWCNAWHEAVDRPNGVAAHIVVGRDRDARIVFILPFALQSNAGYQVIEWLGSQVATYGLGVYDKAFLKQCNGDLQPYWADILSALPQVDAIWLNHVPEAWDGHKHPLGALVSTKSANQTQQVSLQTSYEDLFASKRSSSSRRGVLKRDRSLLGSGQVSFGVPGCPEDAERLIDQMIGQHARNLATRGVHNVLDVRTASFLKLLTRLNDNSQISIFPNYLHVDGKLVAAKLGFIFDGIYWAMISSLDAGDLRKFSPGDYALRKTISACCERGLHTFDFSTGDSSYKDHWSDNSIALHEIIEFRSARGMVWSTAKRASVDTKRVVKNSPYIWPKLEQLRKTTLGQ